MTLSLKPMSDPLPPDNDETTPIIDVSAINETGEAIDARMAVVITARNELGPQDPDKYWELVCPALMGNPHGVAWCGGFALWCLRQVKLCDWTWMQGRGFLFRLEQTENPLPGDIAYFAGLSHHAVVELISDGVVHSIDGNTLPYPQEGVTKKTRPVNAVSQFYSIATLIGETP